MLNPIAEKFTGKGYVPQALTHGTLENDDIEARPELDYFQAEGFDRINRRGLVPFRRSE